MHGRRQRFGCFFGHVRHGCESRTVLEFGAKGGELRGGSGGDGLHAAVDEVADISDDPEPLGSPLGEVAVSHSLHATRDEKTPGLELLCHGFRRDSTKRPIQGGVRN